MNNKYKSQKNERISSRKHGSGYGLIMLICCLSMILGVLFFFKIGGPFGFGAIVICLFMHFLMMRGMFRK